METSPTTIVVSGEEMTIDIPKFTCLVHQQGIRVNVPGFVEINSRNTIECMEKMTQKAWVHISTGELFQILFREIFPDQSVAIPATIKELIEGDFGVVHVAGMIVLGCESLFSGNTKLFFRTPEDHLHPASEQRLVSMLQKMQNLLGGGEQVDVQIAPEDKE